MKKNVSLLTLLLVVAVFFTACTPKAPEPSVTPTEGIVEQTGNTPEPSSDIRVALILNTALGDGGNADSMNEGLQRAGQQFGVQTTVFEALEPGIFEETLRSFAQEGYDLIIGCFPGFNEPINKVSKDFPDVSFAINYSAGYIFDNANATAYDYACWESNYVCGVLAGYLTKTGLLGHIIGGEDSNIIANYNAYVKGAQSVFEGASVEIVDANTFTDAAKGKEIALSLYAKDVDVILGDAGVTTLGMIEAAVETGKYVIGDAEDHSAYGPGNVVMDTRLGFGDGIVEIIRLYLNNELDGETHYANYANDCIGTFKNKSFAEHVADKELAVRMEEIWSAIEEIEAQIANGELVIEKDTVKR